MTNGIIDIIHARLEILKDKRDTTNNKLEKIYCKKKIRILIKTLMNLKSEV